MQLLRKLKNKKRVLGEQYSRAMESLRTIMALSLRFQMVVKGKRQSDLKPEKKILAVNYFYKSSKRQDDDKVKIMLAHDQNSKLFVGRNITSAAFTLTRSIFQLVKILWRSPSQNSPIPSDLDPQSSRLIIKIE
jgi:hypothetical protein